ncbi:unnamed protein product [Lactuca saligna]|uniref:Uncharacterized protein n=1 Tax=Lactuca saligna TaxID=75948 RepID=A0AA35Z4B4_LACSI|nr:unnamed protein product [Lactuca saligna]
MNHAFQEFGNLVFPHHGTFSVLSSLGVSSDKLVDTVASTTPISSAVVSDDNHGADLEEPISLPKSGITSKPSSFLDSLFQAPSDYDEPFSLAPVSPARVQSVLESPSHSVSLDYDSLEDDNQDDDKQSEPENLLQGSPVHNNLDEDALMEAVVKEP